MYLKKVINPSEETMNRKKWILRPKIITKYYLNAVIVLKMKEKI